MKKAPACPNCGSEIGVIVELGSHDKVIGVKFFCDRCGWSKHTWKFAVQKLYGVLSW
jgi:ribosomal protein S27AE